MKKKRAFALCLLFPFFLSFLSACANRAPQAPVSSAPSSVLSSAVSLAESSSAPPPSSAAPSSSETASSSSVSSEKAVPSDSEQISALRLDASVSQFVVSHHSGQIAVSRKTGDQMSFSVIDTKSGRETAVPSISGNLYDPRWSFDDKYLIVEEGTAVLHTTHLLAALPLKEKASFSDTAAVWASSGEYLAISKVNKLKPTVEMELEGTTDIFLINADTLSEKLFLKADADTLYTPEKWDGVNLYVRKSSLISNKGETIRLKVLLATPIQSKP